MRAWLFIVGVGCSGGLEPEPQDTGPGPVVGLPDNVPPEGPATVEAFLGGGFSTLAAYEGIASVYGSALLVRKLDGSLSLSISATGLAPNVPHSAHLHQWPCAYEGGGHYYIDPATPEIGETNEIWATLTPDADGNANWYQSFAAPARGDAMAIVIHEPESGNKLACADLLPEQIVGAKATGTIAPFAYYEAIDETITGTASIVMSGSSTLELSLSGLSEANQYAAHLHALPCGALDGGGHYKFDPSIVETLAENEVWPDTTVQAGGTVSATVAIPGHMLREDAQAVVIHRIAGAEVPKVACADLTREKYLTMTTYGTFSPLPTAGGATVAGSAQLDRRLDGATILTVDVRQLTPNAEYPVHLHRLPCGVLDGGGHYLVDAALADGVETNELWAAVQADGTGAAKRSVGITHSARTEAQSAVIHSADGTRLACANLY